MTGLKQVQSWVSPRRVLYYFRVHCTHLLDLPDRRHELNRVGVLDLVAFENTLAQEP
jgi:hypothetical protein